MQNGGRIQIVHPSLADFLLDPKSTRFYIDSSQIQQFLFQQCVTVMSGQLKFNICNIETSYKWNTDISDLQTKITKNISLELQYSCLYWIHHLIQCDKSLVARSEIIWTSIFVNLKTLFWIECLSLLGKVNFGLQNIKQLQWWLNTMHLDHIYMCEVYYFISKFYIPISVSTPHIYISALSFAPHNSLIYKTCHMYFPQRLLLRSQSNKHWRAESLILYGNSDEAYIGIFPLTNMIYSISSDHELQIWDPYTGHMLKQNLIGHKSFVSAVVFWSQKNIVISGSSDSTICLWDLSTFKSVYQPLNTHSGKVMLLLLTQDQKMLFSACSKKIIAWNLSQGFPTIVYILQPLYIIWSLCLTMNDENLICGTSSYIILVWDASTGSPISELGNPDFRVVSAVSCSPIANQLVCGYYKGWIILWDLDNHCSVKTKRIGDYPIVSTLFTRDGNHVIVASAVMGIYIYGTDTMGQICDPLITRGGDILNVALSEDEHHLAAALENGCIQVWDFNALLEESKLGYRNVNGFACIAMSTVDQVCIYDIHSGNLVSQLVIRNTTSLACIFGAQYLLAGKSTGKIIIWDMKSSEPQFKEIEGHTEPIKQIAPCGMNSEVVSWAWDGTLRLWDLTFPEVLSSKSSHVHTKLLFLQDGKTIENVNIYAQTSLELCGHITSNGWLLYRNQPYIWVPPYYHLSLQNPQIACFPPTGINPSVEVDWSLFVHGHEWTNIFSQH
ncbi:WD40 repeat-like protein [Pluteus cervinus]|uniref:WD40 repeat-like protein n=1 Tax=Pluteus cervinus TaxID=181527 RepID=A0ACD3ARB0_9AGAR|nr:WD40 repeat-like protein [Pluteus cervinus]